MITYSPADDETDGVRKNSLSVQIGKRDGGGLAPVATTTRVDLDHGTTAPTLGECACPSPRPRPVLEARSSSRLGGLLKRILRGSSRKKSLQGLQLARSIRKRSRYVLPTWSFENNGERDLRDRDAA